MLAMVWKKVGSGNFSDCPNGSRPWIWDVFGECAQDGWDEASVGLGLISILCFAASTFPQYIKACKAGNMDQALSLWFLLGWIGGDSCNLIGSFLADQLPLQTYTAVYYVLADLLMLSLYFHYKFKKRPSASLHSAGDHRLRHRLRVQRAVPAVAAASDPHQLPEEVDAGRLLLAVRPGDAGEHAVRAERAAQEPRGGPERGQLPAAPPALARGQPGRAAARHHHLHTVPGVQGHWHLLGAPAPPPQLTRTPRGHSQEGTSMGRPGAAAPGLGHGGSRGHLEAPAQLRPHLQNLLTAASRNLDSAGSEEEVGRQGQPPPPWDTPQSEAAVPWEPRGRGCSCTPGPLRPPACTLLGAGRGRSRVTPGPCC
uniref:lysosomal amino acid transporter 1 homolog isoform X2 n=1 Tax=Nyctereutes procyonoides TaxID=34880 RepID=UPI002444957C|nr:lysosomal amino acid transporter 1 homolog isoform X2 [Nyctereutes procyonoides]